MFSLNEIKSRMWGMLPQSLTIHQVIPACKMQEWHLVITCQILNVPPKKGICKKIKYANTAKGLDFSLWWGGPLFWQLRSMIVHICVTELGHFHSLSVSWLRDGPESLWIGASKLSLYLQYKKCAKRQDILSLSLSHTHTHTPLTPMSFNVSAQKQREDSN